MLSKLGAGFGKGKLAKFSEWRLPVGVIAFFMGWCLVHGLLAVIPLPWSPAALQLASSRGLLIGWSLGAWYWCIKGLARNRHKSDDFYFQLSVFRVIFFGFFAFGSIIAHGQLVGLVAPYLHAGDQPRQYLPLGSELFRFLPINQLSVHIAMVAFGLSAWAAMLGLQTRVAILVFALAGCYLFGIPNFFGKINHNHHLFWLPLLLAFSPLDRYFSVEQFLPARFAGKYWVKQELTSRLTIEVVILALSIIYFFPGFWKMWENGLAWALSDNIRNHLYTKWLTLAGWRPFFPIDAYPFWYQLGGLLVLFFELSFLVFAVHSPATRRLALWGGVLFHFSTLLFLHIFFVGLVLVYTLFIPWQLLWPQGRRVGVEAGWPTPRPYRTVLVFCLVVHAGYFSAGLANHHGWPFSCYPTFQAYLPGYTQQFWK